MLVEDIESTRDVPIPKNPLERIVGQQRAVEKVRIAIVQRRHLLFVGPPGIGKSMLAKALALNLPRPRQEIRVLHNEADPERPMLEVVSAEALEKEKEGSEPVGEFLGPREVPAHVAEALGFRCPACTFISGDKDMICPRCGANKWVRRAYADLSPFEDLMGDLLDSNVSRPEREIQMIKPDREGREQLLVYRKTTSGKIQVLDRRELERARKPQKKKKVIVPLDRIPFVQATGASETELLGDVKHDPYGSHPDVGTPPYMRVVPGAVHEAHEGVLFIDELSHIQALQPFILTAMQEKRFSIVGRNPYSAGAAVKVADVPCDFVFVGACNISDVDKILAPLRSRIMGGGYEVLLDTTMPDSEENRFRLAQFVAQEIESDGRIPHASREAIEEIVKESRKRAQAIDGIRDALTLRLRDLGGLIRYAGDLAIVESSRLIESGHIKRGIAEAKPIEHQLRDSYGEFWAGADKDKGYGGQPDQGGGYYR